MKRNKSIHLIDTKFIENENVNRIKIICNIYMSIKQVFVNNFFLNFDNSLFNWCWSTNISNVYRVYSLVKALLSYYQDCIQDLE